MDSETILKLFKNVFNVVSKKTKKIIKTKYIQYSPNLGVFLVILKGKQYKLKNAKFGDKHYPWRWDHNWDHYNNWMPDYENKIFRRDCSPYLCALTSDKYLSVTDNEVKYRFDDDTPTQPRKRLFHKMTWRIIYEELLNVKIKNRKPHRWGFLFYNFNIYYFLFVILYRLTDFRLQQ